MVAAAAAAASWSPAARRRAAAGRPGRRLWVLLHCKPREASGAASLLVNLRGMMRVVHYEVILTSSDAPRRSQRPSIPSQHCKASSKPGLSPTRMPAWRAVAKVNVQVETTHCQNGRPSHRARVCSGAKHRRTPRRDRLPRDRWDVSRTALAAVYLFVSTWGEPKLMVKKCWGASARR